MRGSGMERWAGGVGQMTELCKSGAQEWGASPTIKWRAF